MREQLLNDLKELTRQLGIAKGMVLHRRLEMQKNNQVTVDAYDKAINDVWILEQKVKGVHDMLNHML